MTDLPDELVRQAAHCWARGRGFDVIPDNCSCVGCKNGQQARADLRRARWLFVLCALGYLIGAYLLIHMVLEALP
jgi:hypothetical protein